MNNKKCVFIGGKKIGANCLRILLKNKVRPDLVIGNLDDDGRDKSWHESLLKIAKAHKLNTILKTGLKEEKIIAAIKKMAPEIIFIIGGTQIVPKEILDIPKLGCLNIHPALLPKYRGRYSTAHAIFNGEKYTGATLHWMDEGLDSGPIIMQKRVAVSPDDTAKSLYDKVLTQTGAELFEKFLALWLSGKTIPARPQNENLATYFPKGLPNNGQLDWSWSGKKIKNFIRAMTFEPFPPAKFNLGKKEMIIIDKKNSNNF